MEFLSLTPMVRVGHIFFTLSDSMFMSLHVMFLGFFFPCFKMIMCILQGVRNIAAISLNIGYPTACSAPHSIINGFKRLLAVAVETDIDFEEANQVIVL